MSSPLHRRTLAAVLLVSMMPVLGTRIVLADDALSPKLQARVHSIAWLVENKKEWGGWSAIERSLTVEGRLAFRAGSKLRMRGCVLEFVPEKGDELPAIPAGTKNLEIEGHFATREADGDVVFVVESMGNRTDDMSTFRNRRAALQVTSPDEWYELAEWALERGEFYDDEDLLAEAFKARGSGLAAERRGLAADDAEGLLALADKAERLEFSDRLVAQYRHEAWRLRWRQRHTPAEPATADQLAEFAIQLAEALPGTDAKPRLPEEKKSAETIRSYIRNPTTTYERAANDVRPRLHRAFFAEVELTRLLATLDPKLENEEAVAKSIDDDIPEHAAVAVELRGRSLDRKIAGVASMTRTEMTALADRLKKAGEEDRARELLRDWLAAKEETLRRDGADGLIQAANYYEALDNDERKVAQLLIEAHGLDDESPEIATRLEKLGYSLRNGEWVANDGRPIRDPAAPVAQAGGVRIDMSPEQVVAVLGEPRSKSRIATAGQISEVWVYGARNASGFAIHFLRRSRDRETDGRVVKVSERRPR